MLLRKLFLLLILSSAIIYCQNSGDLKSDSTKKGFPLILVKSTIGYSFVNGDYYNSYNSGIAFRLGGYFLFNRDDPAAGRFFIGVSYSHAFNTGGKIFGFADNLALNEYSLEFGRSTNLFSSGIYLYGLIGFVLVDNDASQANTPYYFKEPKFALRAEGGISFSVSDNCAILLSASVDPVMGKNDQINTDVYFSGNQSLFNFAGYIFNVGIGLSYGL